MSVATVIAAVAFAAWGYLLLAHGRFWLCRQREDDDTSPTTFDAGEAWPKVVAIVPARNEADVLPRSLTSLAAQNYPGDFSILLVDDQSSDGTAVVARKIAETAPRQITVVPGAPLPASWTGKVWAMNQGIAAANASAVAPDYLLLTDADIEYHPGVLTSLVARARRRRLSLTSVMAKLNCETFAERVFVPAFIFFFQMLYPFAWVNRASRSTAAAAGGCMLADRAALANAGGIQAIRGALIDDCALAAVMKQQGPIWLGLSERVLSLRVYSSVDEIRRMVARSAYAQLRYSPLLLLGTVVGMALLYLAPPILAVAAGYPANLLGAAAFVGMAIAFQPVLRLYGLSPLWGLALPLIAAAYLAFTVDSAYQHRAGRGGLWKGRVQAGAGKQ